MRSMDISNGEGIGVSLFVQGCHFHCPGCFNSEAWSFDGGYEWNAESEKKFWQIVKNPYITRISILGGEPLSDENLEGMLDLIRSIRATFPQKSIWLYTGYTVEDILDSIGCDEHGSFFFVEEDRLRYEIIALCNIIVDGRYIHNLKDPTLHWRGSSNQRVINVQESFRTGQLVLYT